MNAEIAQRIAEMIQNREYHTAVELLQQHGCTVRNDQPPLLVVQRDRRIAILSAFRPLAFNRRAIMQLFQIETPTPCTPCDEKEAFRG